MQIGTSGMAWTWAVTQFVIARLVWSLAFTWMTIIRHFRGMKQADKLVNFRWINACASFSRSGIPFEQLEVTEQLCWRYAAKWDIGKQQQLICLKMNNTTKSTSQMFSDSKCQKKRLTPTLPIGHMTASIFYLSINQAPNFQNCCHSTSFWKEVPYLSNHV